jgi:peptidoglycan/LPS O-acetylase OafA/YrhL
MDQRGLGLRRITSDGRWVPEIDALRFIAIASVVVFHISGELLRRSGHPVDVQPRYAWLEWICHNGDRGVRLFFVISGYILCQPFLRQNLEHRKKVSLTYYYLRRLTRLEPPYILSLLICTAAIKIFWHTGWHELLPHLFASMFYLHGLVYHQMSTINFVTWSLEIEAQFYILAPLLAAVFLIRNAATRRMVMFAAMVGFGLLPQYLPHVDVGVTIFFYLNYFLAGFLLADLLLSPAAVLQRHWRWDIASLIFWPAIFGIAAEWPPMHFWMPFLVLPVYLAAFRGPISNKIFNIRSIALIGGMCYSIYLMHELTIETFFKFTRRFTGFHDYLLNWGLQIALLGGAVLCVGTAFYLLVERPFMDTALPRRLAALFQSRSAEK